MKEFGSKNLEEWIEDIIEAERSTPVSPRLAEKIMMQLSEEPAPPVVLPLYVRSFHYLIKAACIAAAILSGIYLGNLYSTGNTYQDNQEQAALHDGYIEGIDVLLNEQ